VAKLASPDDLAAEIAANFPKANDSQGGSGDTACRPAEAAIGKHLRCLMEAEHACYVGSLPWCTPSARCTATGKHVIIVSRVPRSKCWCSCSDSALAST